MNLLETIRALDAPYVVWLHPTEALHLCADEPDFQFFSIDSFETGLLRYYTARGPVRLRLRAPTAPPVSPEEIDAMLARVGT